MEIARAIVGFGAAQREPVADLDDRPKAKIARRADRAATAVFDPLIRSEASIGAVLYTLTLWLNLEYAAGSLRVVPGSSFDVAFDVLTDEVERAKDDVRHLRDVEAAARMNARRVAATLRVLGYFLAFPIHAPAGGAT